MSFNCVSVSVMSVHRVSVSIMSVHRVSDNVISVHRVSAGVMSVHHVSVSVMQVNRVSVSVMSVHSVSVSLMAGRGRYCLIRLDSTRLASLLGHTLQRTTNRTLDSPVCGHLNVLVNYNKTLPEKIGNFIKPTAVTTAVVRFHKNIATFQLF